MSTFSPKKLELFLRRRFLNVLERLTIRTGHKHRPPPSVKKLLLLRQDRLGDVIMSTPLMVALHDQFPLAEIHILLGRNNATIRPLLPVPVKTWVYAKSI